MNRFFDFLFSVLIALVVLTGCTHCPCPSDNPFFHGEWMVEDDSTTRLIVSRNKILSEYIDNTDLPYAPAVRRHDYDFSIHKIRPIKNGIEYLGFVYVHGSRLDNERRDAGSWSLIQITKDKNGQRIEHSFTRCYGKNSEDKTYQVESLSWNEAIRTVCSDSYKAYDKGLMRPPPPALEPEIQPAHVEDYFGTWKAVHSGNKMDISPGMIEVHFTNSISLFEILKKRVFSDRTYYLVYKTSSTDNHGRWGLIRILKDKSKNSIIVEFSPCYYAPKEDYDIEDLSWKEGVMTVCRDDSLEFPRKLLFNERYVQNSTIGSP